MSGNNTYPPLNVHFTATFHINKREEVEPFQSISGLQAKLVKEEGKKLPNTVFENLILRRGYNPNSKLVAWCMNAINNKVFQAKDITIQLLDSQHELISAWAVEKAIPVGWGIEALHAQDPKVLIEVIELKYQRFHVLNGKGSNVAPMKRGLRQS